MNPNNMHDPNHLEKKGFGHKIKGHFIRIKEKAHSLLKKHFPERFWGPVKSQPTGHHINNRDHHKS